MSDERLDSDQHRGRYNAPKTNEVAMVFKSSDGIRPNNRDICIYPKQRQQYRISTLNPNCDPMIYVLFFPCGEKSFRVNQCFTKLQFYQVATKCFWNRIRCFQNFVIDIVTYIAC
ncbi:ATP-dependent DNA helicase [Trichonephila clavipes]|nr:ATP-dependent DNA helicase [Trichonephila clavipes]